MENSKYVFFLGGKDAEMVHISEKLAEAGMEVVNKNLGWGAKASSYAEEIAATAAAGKLPVIVELEVDIDLPQGTINIDHHNERTGEPAAILQVLSLLGLNPNRYDRLIAANDEGFIFGMQAIGATAKEILDIRAFDRACQGITPEMELEAEHAISKKEIVGGLTVVRMAHSKCATVTDRLFGQCEFLLILSGDGEVNFYAFSADEAAKALVSAVNQKFSGGWVFGGGTGWGGYPNHEEVLTFIKAELQ